MPNLRCVIDFDVLSGDQQWKQIRLRLDPETLRKGAELQALQREGGKPHSFETVVSIALDELHKSLITSS